MIEAGSLVLWVAKYNCPNCKKHLGDELILSKDDLWLKVSLNKECDSCGFQGLLTENCIKLEMKGVRLT